MVAVAVSFGKFSVVVVVVVVSLEAIALMECWNSLHSVALF